MDSEDEDAAAGGVARDGPDAADAATDPGRRDSTCCNLEKHPEFRWAVAQHGHLFIWD